jgi:phosphoglycerate dehydrogenase-like enzyme
MLIVFHGRNAASFEPGFADLVGPGHTIVTVPDRPTSDTDIASIRTADVLIGVTLDKQHPRPERVRLYHAPAAGIDGIDRSCLPTGTPVCRCFGHERPIAEYVMAALLARHVPIAAADRDLRKGRWSFYADGLDTLHDELGDRTVGLLGFGHIGREVAARARAFGMRVTAANRSPIAPTPLLDLRFGLDELREFMGSADYIVVSLPNVAETRGLVNAAALAAMRPTGVIVNVGRGPVIDEAALYRALETRSIGGAVIDTWYVYPSAANPVTHPAALPFHELDNCVLTPHMSGWTHGTIRRRKETMAENIRRLAASEELLNAA